MSEPHLTPPEVDPADTTQEDVYRCDGCGCWTDDPQAYNDRKGRRLLGCDACYQRVIGFEIEAVIAAAAQGRPRSMDPAMARYLFRHAEEHDRAIWRKRGE